MVNGRFLHKGGIFLSAMMLIHLLSLMLLTVLENTRTTTDFYIKTLHMYEARIMKELFLADYQRLTYAEQGSVNYNVGRVIYEFNVSSISAPSVLPKFCQVIWKK